MKQVSDLLGVSVQTLYYYEKEELLPDVKRDEQNHRIYDEEAITWLEMIIMMKRIDISIQEIREYAKLLKQGNASLGNRLKIIQKYKKYIEDKIEKMEVTYSLLKEKEAFYQEALGSQMDSRSFSEEAKMFRKRINLEDFDQFPFDSNEL